MKSFVELLKYNTFKSYYTTDFRIMTSRYSELQSTNVLADRRLYRYKQVTIDLY